MIHNNKLNVKVNGLLCNFIIFLLLFPTIYIIVLINQTFFNRTFSWEELLSYKNYFYFLLILVCGLIVHGVIKYILYKFLHIKSVSMKIKNHMFFLFSEQELTVKQAKILWLLPFLILFVIIILSFIFFDIYISVSFAFLLLMTSDDVIMYYHLLKFNNHDHYIQARDYLGFTIKPR